MTLPMLIVKQQAAAADAELLGLLGRPLDDADHARSLELMRGHAAMDAARAEARSYADAAVAKLAAVRELQQSNPAAFAEAERFETVLKVLTDLAYSAIDRAN
ncbi:MAG: hypothetical protein RL038_206, partial [Actinomycetota bacterium]